MAATRQEIMNAIRKADAAGDAAGAKRLVAMLDAQPPEEELNAFGRAFQPIDDSMRIAADSMTMGLTDKALGEEDQMKTRESRERMGWTGTAVDIGAGMVNPVRVGGKVGGAVLGGAQGALDAYGHQDSWVPDPYEIGKGALVGSGLGAAGAKLGEWGGGLYDKFKGRNVKEPFKSSDDLAAEAVRREEMGYPKFAEDYQARADRVAKAEAAQGGSRDEFGKMLSGMDLTPAERAAGEAATKAPGLAKKGVIGAGKVIDRFMPNKKLLTAAGLVESMLYGLPVKTLALGGGAAGISAAGKKLAKPPKAEVDNLLSIMRDPGGKGYRVDDTGRNAARDLLAKFGMSAGRNLTNR